VYLLDSIAEARIEEAIGQGRLDQLPGAGEPLALDDDSLVPEHLRAAYRLMKNSGFLPPEIELHGEIRDVESLIGCLQDSEQRAAAVKRLALLRARLGSERCGNLALHGDYHRALADKIGGDS